VARKRGLVVVATALCVSLLMACSSGSSNATSTSLSHGAATTVAGAPSAVATTAAGGTSSDVCARIVLADAQALTPQPLRPATDAGAGVCVFHNAGADLTVNIAVNDVDQKVYKTLLQFGDNELAGVGDAAYWNEPAPGQSTPQLEARKGAETCFIQSNNPPDTTLKTTGTAPYGLTVTDADALAYVQLMAKVCEDVFAAR
jgi:hypothetical protein